jgi:hypothetical protein
MNIGPQVPVQMMHRLHSSPLRTQTEDDGADFADQAMLMLHRAHPRASLWEYQDLLRRVNIQATEKSIRKWFKYRFCRLWVMEKKSIGTGCDPIEVSDAVAFLRETPLRRIKFADETNIKGKDFYNPYKRVRRCPLTGIVPTAVVPHDFDVSYTIQGLCGMDPRAPGRFQACIHEASTTSDGDTFDIFIEEMVENGNLRGGDFLVIDKPSIRRSKMGKAMAKSLWEDHGIFVIFLSNRAPGYSPIDVLWYAVRRRLKESHELRSMFQRGKSCRRVVKHFLRGITKHDVKSAYTVCHYY